MASLLIRGGRVVDPSQSLDALRDLRVSGGVVSEIGERLTPRAEEDVFDASGAVVAPGFIDMHVHLREPGEPHKETIETGTQAALRGGFTAVACMPNTKPALDSAEAIAALLRELATRARCRVYPVGALTRARAGEVSCDYAALSAAGAVAFSDDGNTVMDARVLRDCARAAGATPGVFISHCEDERIKGDAVMHEGMVSRALGVTGSPSLAEDVIVARDLAIGLATGRPWHIAHLTTAGAIGYVQHARANGAHVTCEVTPHHLLFTDERVRELGGNAKVNPPLRAEDDARRLRDAVRDGTIDAFATDHAPHTHDEKHAPLALASVGFSGLEIALGAYALAVPNLPLPRFVALLSCNPARILGVRGGTLALGAAADITIFADRPWSVDSTRFASKGRSTPFEGLRLPRRAIATIAGGELAWQEE